MRNLSFKNQELLNFLAFIFLAILLSSCSVSRYKLETYLTNPADRQIALERFSVSWRDFLELHTVAQGREIYNLPCILDLCPGRTTQQELANFLSDHASSIGKVKDNSKNYYWGFTLSGGMHPDFDFAFQCDKGMLRYIDITSVEPTFFFPRSLRFPGILEKFNNTPDIYIEISYARDRDRSGYWLTIISNDQGISARYHYVVLNPREPVQICPNVLPGLTWISLQHPDEQVMIRDRKYPLLHSSHFSIEEVIGLESEVFIERVAKSPDGCIEVPPFSELIND